MATPNLPTRVKFRLTKDHRASGVADKHRTILKLPMENKGRFSNRILAALDSNKIIGLRAGTQPHRFIGVWVVVVKDRVFVRTWDNKPEGWYQTFLKEPEGRIQVAEREVRVRARKARGERLMDAIDRAYAEKYPTPGSRKYVEGFALARRRATTRQRAK